MPEYDQDAGRVEVPDTRSASPYVMFCKDRKLDFTLASAEWRQMTAEERYVGSLPRVSYFLTSIACSRI